MNPKNLAAKLENIKMLADECLAALNLLEGTSSLKKAHRALLKENRLNLKPDFTMPIRPFIKKYAKGMSGPKKFTLILAYMAKGDKSIQVPLEGIKNAWDKMTSSSLLGMKFNRFYSGQAKDNDWVESKKSGSYNLRPLWMDIFT